MVYAAPDRSTLRVGISRDVQDDSNNTFGTQEINDLINEGIVELNRLRPKEYLTDLAITDSVFSYTLPSVQDLFRVEVWRNGGFYWLSDRGDGSTTGWEFFGGRLLLPSTWDLDADIDLLRLWGYSDREVLQADEDILDAVTAEDEQLIRAFAKHTIFQKLVADRALFQQWQTQSNNTDVSPTQLLGMAQVYQQAWRALQGRARLLRRSS